MFGSVAQKPAEPLLEYVVVVLLGVFVVAMVVMWMKGRKKGCCTRYRQEGGGQNIMVDFTVGIMLFMAFLLLYAVFWVVERFRRPTRLERMGRKTETMMLFSFGLFKE